MSQIDCLRSLADWRLFTRRLLVSFAVRHPGCVCCSDLTMAYNHALWAECEAVHNYHAPLVESTSVNTKTRGGYWLLAP